METGQKRLIIALVVILALVVIVGGISYANKQGKWFGGNSKEMLTAVATDPQIVAQELRKVGYPIKEKYATFTDLITDVNAKGHEAAKVTGEINVGGKTGYEVLVAGKTGVWVVNGSKLYTFYLDKSEPLTSEEKDAFAAMTF